ncbi:MAG: BREX system ATP-binding domain-containing protein [Bacillota bacterium]
MRPAEAQRIIESLRKGIPPDGYVRNFTVGRESEIHELTDFLQRGQSGVLLLKANPGSGKTHLLRFVRETALAEGFVVSLVTLDSRSSVRFNRMDQIVGALLRNLEIPTSNNKGIRPFFDFICNEIELAKTSNESTKFWERLTNKWRWDYSDVLDSPALFVALRAWATGNPIKKSLIEDWLFQPWIYQTQRKRLYKELVETLRACFRDRRAEWQFYSDGIFIFNQQRYYQCWAVLRDINSLSLSAGLKGLVLLFDEFEDVIHNLRNISYQQSAFWNLFEFYSGRQFPGLSFFAVTPDFARKCKGVLLKKNVWDFDYSRFDQLPTFEMSPLSTPELKELALKIIETHGLAFGWEPDLVMRSTDFLAMVEQAAACPVQDRTRYTIKEVVKKLDRLLEDSA